MFRSTDHWLQAASITRIVLISENATVLLMTSGTPQFDSGVYEAYPVSNSGM